MAKCDTQTPPFQTLREVDEHWLAVIRHTLAGGARGSIGKNLGERDCTVLHPTLVDVVGLEAGDNYHSAACSGHGDREQTFAAWLAKGAEI